MDNNCLQVNVDTQKLVLSSKSLFYKTENFIKQTKYVSNIDMLVSKLCETIILHTNNLIKKDEKLEEIDCFLVSTKDNAFSFNFKFGYQIGLNLNKEDIVFFDFIDNKEISSNQKIEEYVNTNKTIEIEIKKSKKLVKNQDFNKLYLVSNVSNINLPRLSSSQKEIVETVDKNILVQGVAGSGKTNICIDKIIFTSCKNYTGKVLYTTFSRGLLTDTKLKVDSYIKDLEFVLNKHKTKDIVFLDENHKKALENKLGIYFFSDDDNLIFDKIEKIIFYLKNKVDYLLIEDIYKLKFGDNQKFVNQNYFINTYSKNLTNHQIEKCFNKLSKFSKEIIYKEIFGMIFGFYSLEEKLEIMPLDRYIEARKNSFSKQECETIYQIAVDYKKHCQKNNLLDNNLASKKIIDSLTNNFEYSLSIIDEVQDYTQVNLCLFKKLSLKLFCVGDALQMINPAYFNFGYLKNLLYEKDLTDVSTLKHNYRNSAKIESIIDALGEINKNEFGTHNFVLKGESVDNGIDTKAVFVREVDFIKEIAKSKFDNFTFVVADLKQKKELQSLIKNQEILTVSEIKGLERNTIVSYNLLTSNIDKWHSLEQNKVNHKQADENSVYRYYYNLFYVGVSRAKQNLFVVENNKINQFEKFFKENFENKNTLQALKMLSEIVSKIEFSQQEFVDRVNEFIKLEQYDNARFAANKVKDSETKINLLRTIEVYENLIQYGKYREAGIKFWEYGLIDQAKQQFILSNDTILIELVDKCSKNSNNDLNIDIVNYFLDVKDNKIAQEFILDTVKKDIKSLKNSFIEIKENFNVKSKEIKSGKQRN
ncbi:MAG: hypothetical protein IJB10_00340 [Clostridia bacterium]|nr:hypothetical protein [Clostridia bacterium]